MKKIKTGYNIIEKEYSQKKKMELISMKTEFMILLTTILLLFGIVQKAEAYNESSSSGKGKRLATLYTYEKTDAFRKAGKSQKWLYRTSDLPEMKIKIYEDGVELKLESIEYYEIDDDNWKMITTGTLFDTRTVKNGVYSFSSIIPEGIPYHKLTVRYKGKEIKYLLDWGMAIVVDENGEPVDEITEIDLYSGDKGNE